MASVVGGLFRAAPTHITAAARPDPGALSLASVTRGSGSGGSGTNTVVGSGGDPRFAGGLPAGSEQVVATQTQLAGGTLVTLNDGSTIHFVGVLHVDAIIH
jgi:hypothetical protein